jgi:hypothetical protein
VREEQKEKQMLNDFISKVFSLDEGVRSVSIYHEQYMVAGKMREGVKSLDPEEEAKIIDVSLSRISEMVRKWQTWFGEMCCMSIRYEKINLGLFPLKGGRTLVISTEPSLDTHAIFEKVRSIRPGPEVLSELR